MADLAALRKRIAEATGPDRELDRQIALACGWERLDVSDRYWRKGGYRWFREDDHHPPLFTYGLDAALALVERMLPGWLWTVQKCTRGNFEATLLAPGYVDDGSSECAAAVGHSPALAVLSALLAAIDTGGADAT